MHTFVCLSQLLSHWIVHWPLNDFWWFLWIFSFVHPHNYFEPVFSSLLTPCMQNCLLIVLFVPDSSGTYTKHHCRGVSWRRRNLLARWLVWKVSPSPFIPPSPIFSANSLSRFQKPSCLQTLVQNSLHQSQHLVLSLFHESPWASY